MNSLKRVQFRFELLDGQTACLDAPDERQCDVAVRADKDWRVWFVGLVRNFRSHDSANYNLVIRPEDIAGNRLCGCDILHVAARVCDRTVIGWGIFPPD